ncbi:hypothetical protein [Amycolatopsis anabasis]|uniref:hypothetical protein n=1 Tax=Amycolatopsis anabasis TaxID=1840409 RepID=UPI00131D598C|nr:hypothetical protein [Amycolatopsis anabasis]
MNEARQEMHGDPEMMRRFAERVNIPSTEAVTLPPDMAPCEGGMPGCASFTTADVAATVTLAQFLAETRDDIATLKAAATVATVDYLVTDQAGARAAFGAVVED